MRGVRLQLERWAVGMEAIKRCVFAGEISFRHCLARRIRRAPLPFPHNKAMMLALHQEHTLSDMFTKHLLRRNIRFEEDLV
jgi:hypothetical protein